VPEDVISEETRREAVRAVRRTMLQLVDTSGMRSRAASFEVGTAFRNVFNTILNEISQRDQVMLNLSTLNTADEYLFHHSVNVAILAGIVGMAMGYNRSQ